MMIFTRRDKRIKLLWFEMLDFPVKEQDKYLSIVIWFGIGHQGYVFTIV